MKKKALSRQLTDQQSARLGAYLAAGLTASMGVSATEAELIYFEVSPAKVIGPDIGYSISFGSIDLAGPSYVFDDVTAPSFRLFLEGNSLVWGLGYYGIQFAIQGIDPYDSTALRFAYNAPIGSTLTFSDRATGIGVFDGWIAGETAYLGLRMDLGLDSYSYGWARLSFGLELEDPVTISGFAFQSTPNVTISAGDTGGGPEPIPEPGTWAAAALLAGGATYLRWRRRRDETQKEAA